MSVVLPEVLFSFYFFFASLKILSHARSSFLAFFMAGGWKSNSDSTHSKVSDECGVYGGVLRPTPRSLATVAV